MKKIFKSLALILLTLCMVMSVAACNFVSVEVKNPNDDPNNPTISNGIPFNGNAVVTETYQKNYKVKSVDLKLQNSKDKTKLSTIDIVDSVYNSTVAIIATSPTGSRGAGSGIIVDIDVNYESSSVVTSNFLYVITCHHVIDGAGEIAVYLPKLVDETTGEYINYSSTKPVDAGTYSVRVTVFEDDNYEEAYDELEFEIAPAPIELKLPIQQRHMTEQQVQL